MESSSSGSGSMQCSGGGDQEEFDSRNECFSAFLNSSNTCNHGCGGDLASIRQPQLPPPRFPSHSHHQNHPSSSSLYDPFSTDLGSSTQSTQPPTTATTTTTTTTTTPFLNLDMVLSGGGFASASPPSSAHTTGTSWGWSNPEQQVQTCGSGTPSLNPSSSIPPSSGHSHESSPTNNVLLVRNPKKRSRASRRAPTTVLTTDTSNFRAMVQEFTGIPAPPFSATAFLGSRLNLFSTSSLLRSGLEQAISYPLRPSSSYNKIPTPSPLAPTTTTNAITSGLPITTSYNAYNPTSIPFELGLTTQTQTQTQTQSQNFLNMESPLPTFPSYLQPSPTFSTKSPTYSTTSVAALEAFHRSQGQLSSNHIGNATKSLNEEWGVIGEQEE